MAINTGMDIIVFTVNAAITTDVKKRSTNKKNVKNVKRDKKTFFKTLKKWFVLIISLAAQG